MLRIRRAAGAWAARAVVAVAAVAVAACAHEARRTPPPKDFPPYWDLVTRLDLDRAVLAAHSPAEVKLAESLRRATAGDTKRAIVVLDSLARGEATDSIVRRVSLVVLAGLLHTEHRWSALRALPVVPGIHRDSADLAGVEAWAAAFVGARPPHARFRSDSAIFPIVLSPLGVPMLPVEINGRRFLFWLDTGASMTMISEDVARATGILARSPDSLEAVTAVGRLRVLPAMIGMLHVGPLDWRDAPAMIVGDAEFSVLDSSAAGHASRARIDGIVGWDVLRQLDIRIDHPGGVLTMRRPDRENLALSRRNLFWLGYPLVRATGANDSTLIFGLDTGLRETYVTRALATAVGLTPVQVEKRRIGAIGGDSIVRGEALTGITLKIGMAVLAMRSVTVRAPVVAGFVALDGVLGSDVGASGVVRIDATNGIYDVRPGR